MPEDIKDAVKQLMDQSILEMQAKMLQDEFEYWSVESDYLHGKISTKEYLKLQYGIEDAL